MIVGMIKCNDAIRFNVVLLILKLPHIHVIIVFLLIGRIEIIFVNTVIPQNDICLHVNVYPVNAVMMIIISMIVPEIHGFLLF
jgi:hypothetical protein